jgi:hypothetical protein
MREIEARLHDMLLEIAPDLYDEGEQARIIAEASAIFGRSERKASRGSNEMVRESRMMDSILQAIGHLPDWDSDEPSYIDGRGMTPDQIVKAASRSGGYKPDLGLDILNDGDLDVFYGEPDQDPNGYDMDDIATLKDGDDAHPETYFFTPGRGRHRSDSQSRAGND